MICDFAQFYHIYNIEDFDIEYVACLAAGLPSDSRSVMALTGLTINPDLLIHAATFDAINTIKWMLSKDGRTNNNRPQSLVQLLAPAKKEETDIVSFDTEEEFMRAMARFKR